jgi:threonine dehydratase
MNQKRLNSQLIDKAASTIDPVFLHSPQYECESLSRILQARVILKVETQNPIRCFKGRGADLLVSQSNSRQLICASAGNFGQAMAYACRKKGIELSVYASTAANPLKIQRMKDLGARVVLEGDDFDAAKTEAKRMAAARNIRFVEDGLDVETLIGAGTIAKELLDFPMPIDSIVVPLGNGALLNGIATYTKTVKPAIRTIAVQAAGASAMIDSWKQGRIIEHTSIHTIADGIGVRIPIPEAVNDMSGIVDEGIVVAEDSIIEAMKLLHRHAGIVVEPAGAVGISAMLENPLLFKDKIVAIIICGGNLTPEQMQKWIY